MDAGKIVRIIAVLFAVVAGLATIPQEAVIIAVLGLIAGWFVEDEYTQRFLIVAIALGVCNGALEPIPAVGSYLSAMLGSLSLLFYAGACTVIVVGLVNRLKP